MSDNIITSESGAKSSTAPDFTLLPTLGLVKAIERFELGIPQYGRDNWHQGLNDRAYLLERLSHVIGHCFKLRDAIDKVGRNLMLSKEEIDDHVGAILWFGFMAACHHDVQVLDLMRAVKEQKEREAELKARMRA